MGKRIAKSILKCGKWNYNEFPDINKAVVLMAPHTSMLDFIYGKLYFIASGKKPTILVKKEIFFWPLGHILKKLGAIPVDRGKRTGITDMAIESFNNKGVCFYLVITPEGTRKKTKNWKKGFIRIAQATNVPVVCGFIDIRTRSMGVMEEPLDMSGTDDEIMERVKRRYLGFKGIHPEKFATGYE